MVCVCVCLSACLPLRALITSGVIFFTAFLHFQLLYMILAVDKMDGCGPINATHHECPPKKTKVTQY